MKKHVPPIKVMTGKKCISETIEIFQDGGSTRTPILQHRQSPAENCPRTETDDRARKVQTDSQSMVSRGHRGAKRTQAQTTQADRSIYIFTPKMLTHMTRQECLLFRTYKEAEAPFSLYFV